LRAETEFTVDEDRWRMKNAHQDSAMDWSTYLGVLETRRFFLMVHTVNRNMFQIIPKRAFESPDREADFRELLKRHIEKYRQKEIGAKGWIAGFLVGVLIVLLAYACIMTVTIPFLLLPQ
jgi:hypothetical protein